MYTVNKAQYSYDLRDDDRLTQKMFRTITYGKGSFVYLRPKLWNTMPLEMKNAISLQDFKDRLMT